MATLEDLKRALRQYTNTLRLSSQRPLSDAEYKIGFEILLQGPGQTTYEEFIFPQLSQLFSPLFASRSHISALEIRPGPKSVLGSLPLRLRHKIRRYTAFEPNDFFATSLEECLDSRSRSEAPLPCLEEQPDVRRIPFDLDVGSGSEATQSSARKEKYDIILFCHSMYGMSPKQDFIKQALDMLAQQPEGGLVVIFHRETALNLDGLVCHRTASFPTGKIRVADNHTILDYFARFIAGFVMVDDDLDQVIQSRLREICRSLGRHEQDYPDHLAFSSPEQMIAFTQHAAALPKLTAQVSSINADRVVKNREALIKHSTSILRPTDLREVQLCVRWALKHGTGLTVVGGGHSGNCLQSNVLAVDMGAFDQIHVITQNYQGAVSGPDDGAPFVVAEAGCKTGDIIRTSLAAGLTIPLGARPSVGAGLWLQGGIGHLARLHGLSSDAIVGAVIVSVTDGRVLRIGQIPSQQCPPDAVRPQNESDLLWAIKGAGTNFGIVVSVTFKASLAPMYLVRNSFIPLKDPLEARLRLSEFDGLVASQLPQNCSADAYLYWDGGQLNLAVTKFEYSTTGLPFSESPGIAEGAIWQSEHEQKVVDSVGLFDTELYVSRMHGGHSGSRTHSFKRCLFFKEIGEASIVKRLVSAMEDPPSPLCYLHFLQGGGAISDVTADATAFGCRDWDFACVITAVWPREEDNRIAKSAIDWVYDVVRTLMPFSAGAYAADLGPDPRDAPLAAKAFGRNRDRLARLKLIMDPHNMLAYACPLPKTTAKLKLIILVTGQSCAGKDYCAANWASAFANYSHKNLKTSVVSISDTIKREYAAATGANLGRLQWNRAYKEKHRQALTTFFLNKVSQHPRLPQETFLNVVADAIDVDVLIITGMRDEAPGVTFAPLVPDIRLVEVRVQATEKIRQSRLGISSEYETCDYQSQTNSNNGGTSETTKMNYQPALVFENNTTGEVTVRKFAELRLLPFVHEDLQRLADMVCSTPDFPRPGIQFRHVLNISQQPGGLPLCTTLLRTHFAGDWGKVNAIVCCEAGGFVYAPALASQVNVPLALVRDSGKLPPPTVTVVKHSSYISAEESVNSKNKRIELQCGVVREGGAVVVVDDVISSGETLCAVLQLLKEAGIRMEDVNVMAVVEFPVHRGRELLLQRGFGVVKVQSLLVLGGV